MMEKNIHYTINNNKVVEFTKGFKDFAKYKDKYIVINFGMYPPKSNLYVKTNDKEERIGDNNFIYGWFTKDNMNGDRK